jgi:hypothetical protein
MFKPTTYPLHTTIRALARLAALAAVSLVSSGVSAEETWVRVTSHDQKVSVLFPSHPDKIETLTRKSPAGKIDTRRAQYETEGVLLSIAGTQLPSAALKLAGANKILRNAAEGILDTYLGKKVSEKKMKISGEPAIVLEYLVPDYEDKDHPGYRGIAIALLVDQTLYVVNGLLTKEDPKSKANQQKLLGSIEVHN